MGEVVELGNVTKLDIPPERILNKAFEAGLTEVIIIGYAKDGDFYFASSQADGGDVLWLLEMVKRKLIDVALQMEDQ